MRLSHTSRACITRASVISVHKYTARSMHTEYSQFSLARNGTRPSTMTLAAASGARPHCLVTVALRC
ncbi:hypothetical protein BD311DRAFT_68010 [Dichomitus squalens]|uniref:Uncharacterized protein n=1 Tax=Dichomitus squalens TaxID=114155 RepID=A0A4Q9M942_9APHY|nr:hypothetical protein BD311DRAFT_68010 [Dichomitus squalens]